jgi:hypothetical protein
MNTNTTDQAARITALANQVKGMYSVINRLAKAETITKAALGELSRSVLQYHSDQGHDVGVVNRLISVLSPVNARAAKLFFQAMLPYSFDSETGTFGKLVKKEAIRDGRYYAMAEFLKDEKNTIWTWQEGNIDMAKKPVNYVANVTKAIEVAIKHEVDKAALIKAVMDGGVTADDLINILSQMEVEQQLAEEIAKVA